MNHKIYNDFLEVFVDDNGAQLNSLQKIGEDIEYIWQADAKYWNRSSPILFPIVGKLLDNEYEYKNKTYSLSQHGFARDCKFELVEQEDDLLVFRLKSNEDSLKNYPFSFELYLSYKLVKNNLEVSYKVVNKTEGEILFSIGAHPAFNWPLFDEKKEDFYFEFEDINSLETMPLDNGCITTSRKNIKLDDNKLNLSEKVFSDDALIVENKNINTISFKNRVNEKYIKVKFDGFSHLGLWSMPSGAPFICIEPWHGIADNINHDKKLENKDGILKLLKDEVFNSSYFIEV